MISFVICSRDSRKLAAVSRNIAERMTDRAHELISIPDAQGLADGYNRGIEQSGGEIIVFCHDDVEILATHFSEKVYAHLERFDVAGVAGTTRMVNGMWGWAGPPHIFGQIAKPHPSGHFIAEVFGVPRRAIGGIQGLDGLLIAVRRSSLDRVRFDPQTFEGWHGYDADFTFSAYLAGLRVGVMSDVLVIHASEGNADEQWKIAMNQFTHKHAAKLPLPPPPQRAFVPLQVIARTREELIEVMSPPYWDEA